MTLYLDTSLLVAALTNEAATERTQKWLVQQNSATLAISEWVATEFSAALSMKLRTGQLSIDDRAGALAMFTRLIAESLTVLPISGLHFRAAARLADNYGLGLRAGDALHLAVVSENGATLCSLDRRLTSAGRELGVQTLLV